MFDLKINEEQIVDATLYVQNHKLGSRGRFDGNRTNQVVGVVGENMVRELFGFEPMHEDGFDGGWDIAFGDKKIDVKTVGRNSDVIGDYYSNVVASQMKFAATHFIFTSLNKKTRTLTVVGWISKKDLLKKAEYKRKGDVFKRSNGTSFNLGADGYFIKNSALNQVYSPFELESQLIF